MRGRDFLGTAVRLRDADGASAREADLRTAAGRCYYAVFQSLVEVFGAFNVTLTQTGADHEIAYDALGRLRDGASGSTREALADVHANLHSLKTWRTQADYVIPTLLQRWSFARSTIQNLTRLAENTIEVLDAERANLDAELVQRAGADAVRRSQARKFDRRV